MGADHGNGGTTSAREVVEQAVDALRTRDVARFLGYLHDELTWHVVGAQHLPADGVFESKASFVAEAMPALQAAFDLATLEIDLRTVVADGDTVVVEWSQSARTPAGAPYDDKGHCLVFEVSGGQIRSVREYLDTAYAKRVLAA